MTINELQEIFEKENIYVVPIIGSTDIDDYEGLTFDGELEDFISTLKNIGIKNVFLATKYFSEEEITGNFNIRYEDYVDTIPILEVYPKIESFREYIGKPCEFMVLAKGDNFSLKFADMEDWWEEILIESVEECRKIQEKESIKFKEEDRKFNLKKSKVYKALKSLIDNEYFIKLKTQGAMLAYAEENIEDIFVLEESELKQEIKKLNDILVSRGLK